MSTSSSIPDSQADIDFALIDFALFECRPGVGVVLLPDAPSYTLVAVSNDFISTSGMKKEDVIGRSHFDIFPENPNDPQSSGENSLRSSFAYILQHKKPHSLPLLRYDIPNGDGTFSEKYWKSTNAPVLNEKGEIRYIIHTAEDVTELVKARKTEAAHQKLTTAYQQIEDSQKALSTAHERIIDILESTTDAFYAVDAGFHFTYVNKRAAQLWRKSSESLIGQHYWTVFPNAVNSLSYHKHYEVLETARSVHYETVSPILGIWIDASIYPSKDGGLSVFFRDISERKRAEMALQESEERFRIMANAVPLSMWITDTQGKVEFLNQHWCDYCGVPFFETTAADISVKHLHPDDAPKVMQAFAEAMKTGEPWEIEQRNRSKTGEYRWFLNRANPYKDPSTGKIIKWFGVGTDIHDRKLAEQALKKSEEALEKKVQERTHELEKTNQELKRSNQNLEEFAYAASHDMKEPIRKIHFFADRLKERLMHKLGDENLRYFERLEAGTKRMTTLIDDLLLYSHVNRGVSSVESVDLNQMLSFVLDDLELHIAEKKARIEVGPLPTVQGRQRQLQQLFENLIGNALKYSKAGVTPVVLVSSRLIRGRETDVYSDTVNKDKMYHLIEVQDNGIGFEQSDAERIFNVFTRLHGNTEYRGTGVGLSIAQKVVENHEGHIWAESTPGEGATFKVLLPAE